jgi:uncharacterized damage-inducible protein DinB
MEATMPGNEQGDNSVLIKWFGHNTWASLKLLDFCEGLSDEQLDSTMIGGFGSIRETLMHFVGSEVGYVNQVNDKLPAIPLVRGQWQGFQILKDAVRWAGDELLQLAISARLDTIVRLRPPRRVYEYPLASLMVQAVSHSTEHRTQIAAILTQLGMEPPDMSGWVYMEDMGELFDVGEGAEED